MIIMLITYLLGTVAGFFLGLTGTGGAIITVPILMLLMGMDIVKATGYSIIINCVVGFYAVYLHQKTNNILYSAALRFGLVSSVVTLLSRNIFFTYFPDSIFGVKKETLITLVFLAALTNSAYRALFRSNQVSNSGFTQESSFFKVGLSAVKVGVMSGFIGLTGAFMIIPSLQRHFGLTIKHAIGTSSLIILFNASFGTISEVFLNQHHHYTTEDMLFILTYALFSSLGALFGTRLAKKLNDQHIKTIFGVMLMCLGIYVGYTELRSYR